MKKIYGIAALAAAMTLASCSNNDEPNVIDSVQGVPGYIGISISAPEVDTKAPVGEVGDDAEHAVTSGLAIIFNKTTNIVAETVPFYPEGWTNGADNTDITKWSKNAVKVSDATNVGKVIIVLNAPGDLAKEVSGKSITEVGHVIDKTGLSFAGNTEGNFVMSNATTSTSGNGVDFTGKTFDTKSEAEANATTVYVERVLAKTRYNYNNVAINAGTDDAKISIDGADATKVTVEIVGIGLANTADFSYLVKDCSGWSLTGMDDSNGYRSHWATVKSDLTVSNKAYASYNTPVEAQDKTTFTNLAYVYENTLAATTKKQTAILVTAKINGGNSLYQLGQNGAYYTATGLENHIIDMLKDDNYRVSSDAKTYTTLKASNYELVAAPTQEGKAAYKAYVQIKLGTNEKLYKLDPSKPLTDEGRYTELSLTGENGVNPKLMTEVGYVTGQHKYAVKAWTEGKSYFWVPVQASDVSLAGIVRNHIYDLTISSLKGLGVPVFDPDKEIVPETPDSFTPGSSNEAFLGVSVNILNWAVKSQNVNFNN